MRKKTVFDQRAMPMRTRHDIFPELIDTGCLLPCGEGLYGMGGLFLQVFKYFERSCHQLALKQSPQEFVYPTLLPAATIERFQNPLAPWPLYTLAAPARLPGKTTRAAPPAAKHTGGVHFCKHAICLNCYPQFANRTIPSQPPLIITSQGRCFRHEKNGYKTLERLREFIMREVVYFGGKKPVLHALEATRLQTERWMRRLRLHCWMETANDFFYHRAMPSKTKNRGAPAKWELKITLPGAHTVLTAASFNYHGSHLSALFHITNEKRQPIATACAGFGMERLTYAFLAQHGLRPERWPAALRREIPC